MTSIQSDDPYDNVLVDAAKLASAFIHDRRNMRISPAASQEELRQQLEAFDLDHARNTNDVIRWLFSFLGENNLRSDHPSYFGLFNPPPLISAIAGDIVAATANPQLAVWGHAPAAVEIELHLVKLFASRIWQQGGVGTFTSGGSEANHTALLCALARKFPGWATDGLPPHSRPVIYVSAEAHLAWIKIARATGLGSSAVRLVDTDDGLSLNGDRLNDAMAQDVGSTPILIVGTAGTTGHGSIDHLASLGTVAREYDCYLHVDAAWAGAVVLSPTYRRLLAGIDMADSVTIDPHKWLAVPMGTGLFLSRGWQDLETAFCVSTGYMPSQSYENRDPYIHSLAWSRRFNGGKLFTSIATLGLEGYAAMIDRQVALGKLLRDRLEEAGFTILNETELPLVCFTKRGLEDDHVLEACARVTDSGRAWLTTVTLRGRRCFRACITSFETTETDVQSLVQMMTDTVRTIAD